MHIVEGGHGYGSNAALRAARDHRSSVAAANGFPGFSYRIGAGGTGGDSCPVWTFCPGQDRDNAGRAIDDHHIDKEWADTLRSLFEENLELIVEGHQSSNTAADVDANVIGVFIVDVQARLDKGLFSGGDGYMLIGIVTSYLFFVYIKKGVEIFDLSAKVDAIPAVIIACDLCDAGFSLAESLPRCGQIITQRGNQS